MSNAIDLYPITLDQASRRVGVNIVNPIARLDVNGDVFVRANVTAASNVQAQAATSFKLGGAIGDDTNMISEGESALNLVGKRYVPRRGEPFEVGAGLLRTVNVYDVLDTIGWIRTGSTLKLGGLFTDSDMSINADASAMSFVGGGGAAPSRTVVMYDKVFVEGPIRTSSLLKVGGSFGDNDNYIDSVNALNIVGKSVTYPGVAGGTARNVNIAGNVNVQGPVRATELKLGDTDKYYPPKGFWSFSMNIYEGTNSLNVVGKFISCPLPAASTIVAFYDNVVVNGEVFVKGFGPRRGSVKSASGTIGPMLSFKKGFNDIVGEYLPNVYPTTPYVGSHWFTEPGNTPLSLPVFFFNFRRFIDADGNTRTAGTFSPNSSPSETISWGQARLIWRGCALDNVQRNLSCEINLVTSLNDSLKITVSAFDITTLGDSRGFTTVVSPWFTIAPERLDMTIAMELVI